MDGELGKDLSAGLLALRNYCSSSYQSWTGGSSLLFWRWQSPLLARNGIKPYIRNHLPQSKAQARIKYPIEKMLIFEKVIKYIKRGYLIICDHKLLSNFIDYFSVAKGDTDIRLVFNGTSCGLNDATWSSRFWLPMSGSMTRIIYFGYAVVDIE